LAILLRDWLGSGGEELIGCAVGVADIDAATVVESVDLEVCGSGAKPRFRSRVFAAARAPSKVDSSTRNA
jgi:hypothetical protein